MSAFINITLYASCTSQLRKDHDRPALTSPRVFAVATLSYVPSKFCSNKYVFKWFPSSVWYDRRRFVNVFQHWLIVRLQGLKDCWSVIGIVDLWQVYSWSVVGILDHSWSLGGTFGRSYSYVILYGTIWHTGTTSIPNCDMTKTESIPSFCKTLATTWLSQPCNVNKIKHSQYLTAGKPSTSLVEVKILTLPQRSLRLPKLQCCFPIYI